MSELECFYSPVLDMNYIFFIWVFFGVGWALVVWEEGEGGKVELCDCEKVELADCGL